VDGGGVSMLTGNGVVFFVCFLFFLFCFSFATVQRKQQYQFILLQQQNDGGF
jgi:hypothetical protein